MFNAAGIPAVDVAEKRLGKLRLAGGLSVGVQPSIEGACHFLHAAAHSNVACSLFAQCFVETHEEHVHQSLRERAFAGRSKALEKKPCVKCDQIETPVEGIRNAEIPIKGGVSRPGG